MEPDEIFPDFLSFEDFAALLDEITEGLPPELFVKLNGGVNLQPETLLHPEGDLYILGQYHRGGVLGRYINIYYGSFRQLYGRKSVPVLRRQLEKTLRHEFLHHLESLAGARDLEIQDERDLVRYRERR